MNFLLMLLTSLTISGTLITLSFWLPQTTPDTEKLSPYECGFDPLGSARLPFSLHFFLVAILFLLFDLEIVLLLPLPWTINLPDPMITLSLTLTILTMLTLGLIYEWKQGGLEWTN
uniref:NADH dehydrogenase subunit 3 n=1 Tax=Varanus rudicollis TaxID=169851 RepID=UPI0021824B3B|nr:NADH dehydrogenase subunit 3 [Varanus rudicollis]BDP99525.1 NADH dehydrogenase subunit 3 [Varanus rudicollis]